MAKKYWYGGATDHLGEWDYDNAAGGYTGSNWRLVADDTGCAKPAAGDEVFIDNRAAYNDTDGRYQDIDTNIDATGTGTPDLAAVTISADYDGNIGADGSYLELECSGDAVIEGEGSVYLKVSAGTGVNADVDRLVVNKAQGTLYLSGAENDGSNVAKFAEILAISGTLSIADSTAVDKLTSFEAATISAGSGCKDVLNGTLADLIIVGGTVTWNSPIDTVDIFGGMLRWGSDGDTATGLDCNLANIYPAGRLIWQTADTDVSILKKFVCCGGTLDAQQPTNSQYRKQIGSGASEVSEAWYNSNLRLAARTLSLASGSSIKNYGARITAPAGDSISF
ncbi:hypothetical protein STSP2_03173 [Anaerohalosphaera lusitana]|uniref:Uncharacterized protein n=1 Tax=Anaerohalosphaera lusitana TaxID=1936003 RepID=A0A1U9NPV6_9BACT|nr:hypothetical protein [Anaerohalosphaera lusitana]AQT69973.1 hypothetical protein STSP2_03173 [Anaerohalosphaera lusitana]